MAATLTDFTDCVRRCGALDAECLAAVDRDLLRRCADAASLARKLVRRGWLTDWQAAELLQGRSLAMGPYLLLGPLGSAGRVFQARHRLMKRVVALRVLRPGIPGASVPRFLQEIETAATLAHPHIVTAYDAGRDGDQFYFAMELLDGAGLDEIMRGHTRLPADLACDYVRQAALGLQHAHERGLLHGNIRTASLFVTGQGLVKVLDLGLARQTGPKKGGDSSAMGVRADVYALGCVLHILSAGQPPDERRPLQALPADLPDGLAEVMAKVLAERLEDRYKTAAELAEALEPFTYDDAIPAEAAPEARRGGWRWGCVATTALLLVGLTIGGIVLAQALSPRPAASEPPREVVSTKSTGAYADDLGRKLLPSPSAVPPPATKKRPPEPEHKRTPTPLPEPVPKPAPSPAIEPLPKPAPAPKPSAKPIPKPSPTSTPRPDGRYRTTAILRGHTQHVYHVAFSPDGQTLVSSGNGGMVRLWDVAAAKNLATLGPIASLNCIALSADGKTLVAADEIELWNMATRKKIATLREDTPLATTCLAFSPDGKTLASARFDDEIQLWNVTARRKIATLQGPTEGVACLAFSPDGKTLAAGCYNKTVQLWDVSRRKNTGTLRGHSEMVKCVVFSSDGKTLASGGGDKTVRLWDTASGANTATLKGHASYVTGVAFSPDGKTLASGGGDDMVQLWIVASGEVKATLKGHAEQVNAVAFGPDGKMLASGSNDHTIRLWDVSGGDDTAAREKGTPSAEGSASSRASKASVSDGGDRLRPFEVPRGGKPRP